MILSLDNKAGLRLTMDQTPYPFDVISFDGDILQGKISGRIFCTISFALRDINIYCRVHPCEITEEAEKYIKKSNWAKMPLP